MRTLNKTGKGQEYMIKYFQHKQCQPELVEGGSMLKIIPAFILFFFFLFSLVKPVSAQQLTLQFNHTANGKPLVLADSSYSNAFNERYQLNGLKYYISNIGLKKEARNKEVFLVEAAVNESASINVPAGIYTKLYFTLGVDSALNCSGAQDGALDPLNGMFWTWNSGYIFFKMEGYSSSSTADLNRIEHHVGGYRYPYNVITLIELELPQPLEIKKGEDYTIAFNMNLDKYWKGNSDIKIADQALLMTPGGLALKAADNFKGMFSINSVQ